MLKGPNLNVLKDVRGTEPGRILSLFLSCLRAKRPMNKETVMPDDLLKAGEFARLCGTTKETLRHYKDIGL